MNQDYLNISTSILPLDKVLTAFNMSLSQYLALEKVPFPIVTADGCPVYYSGNTYTVYRNNPLSLTQIENELFDSSSDLFVDFGIFNSILASRNPEDIRFRFLRRKLDNERTQITPIEIKTQSRSSSTDLKYDPLTGRLLRAPKIYHRTENNPYSNFDLINDISPLYESIIKRTNTLSYDPITKKIVEPTVNTEVKSQGNVMSNLSVTSILDKNKEALIVATKLEVGSVAINLVTEQVTKLLPPPLQFISLANQSLTKILIANLINVAVLQTQLKDPRLLAVNEAMLTASYIETISSFDFKSVIDDVLKGIPEDKLNVLINSNT